MAKFLGLDIGTSGCKALLINEHGEILGTGRASYPLSTPQPLWSEQDPEHWWQGVLECIEQIGDRDINAIGLSGQMHGSVFLDSDGQLIRPALLWNDQRTTAECEEIDRTVGADRVRAITFNPPLTGFQLPKLIWLRNHELSNYLRIAQVLLPKDFIRYRLSGVFATEVSDAAGTGLLDVRERTWSDEMLHKLELKAEWFPPVFESDVVSATTKGVPGLADGIPIVGGGGDQAAGAVGTGAVEPGVISLSLGTSGVVFVSTDEPEVDSSYATHTFCHANRHWHRMGVMLSCGGAIRWVRDTQFSGLSYDDMTAMAAAVEPGSKGLTFLPYLTGERSPHNDPYLRAGYVGLTLAHGSAELSRATFEGVTFGLLDNYRALCPNAPDTAQVRVTGGGVTSLFWRQLIADAFNAEVVTLASDEGPAYGAAILAGVGVGAWSDVRSACRALVRSVDSVKPSADSEKIAEAYEKFRSLLPPIQQWIHRFKA